MYLNVILCVKTILEGEIAALPVNPENYYNGDDNFPYKLKKKQRNCGSTCTSVLADNNSLHYGKYHNLWNVIPLLKSTPELVGCFANMNKLTSVIF